MWLSRDLMCGEVELPWFKVRCSDVMREYDAIGEENNTMVCRCGAVELLYSSGLERCVWHGAQ